MTKSIQTLLSDTFTSGVSGFSGLGLSGYSGFSGMPGAFTASGFSGYSGYTGISGYSGESALNVTLERTYNYPGELVTGLGTARWWAPTDIILDDIIVKIISAPLGQDAIFVVRINNVPTHTLLLDEGTTTLSVPVADSLVVGDYITVDVTQIGTTAPGSDLAITFLYRRI